MFGCSPTGCLHQRSTSLSDYCCVQILYSGNATTRSRSHKCGCLPHRKATSIHPASHHWLKPGMFYNEPCVIGREELQSCWWCLVCSGSTAWQLVEQVCSNGHTYRPKPTNPWPISVVQDLGRPTPPPPIQRIVPLHKDSIRILIIYSIVIQLLINNLNVL